MRRFMSDPEYILACAYADAPVAGTLRRAVTAFANLWLAYGERGEDCVAMKEHAEATPGSTLADQLVAAGACDDGLSVVGPNITEYTLARVLAVRGDWADWYNENVRGLHDDVPDDNGPGRWYED